MAQILKDNTFDSPGPKGPTSQDLDSKINLLDPQISFAPTTEPVQDTDTEPYDSQMAEMN